MSARRARRSGAPSRASLAHTAAALLLACCVGAVHAQLSGSLSLVSDYRFRGVTLSDERPAAQVTAVYDHPTGFYVSGFASTVRLTSDGSAGYQALAQGGYALRGRGDIAWDVGALYTDFSHPAGLGYADFYLGAAATAWSARLWYAPRYFGQSYSATYAEFNFTPASEWRVAPLLHIGWLVQQPAPATGPRTRWDGRIGLATSIEQVTLQLSWLTVSSVSNDVYEQHRSRVVFKATYWLP